MRKKSTRNVLEGVTAPIKMILKFKVQMISSITILTAGEPSRRFSSQQFYFECWESRNIRRSTESQLAEVYCCNLYFISLFQIIFFLFSAVSRFVPRPYQILAVPARPVPDFGCSDPSRPLARFLACPVVPLSWDNDGISVPLSRKVSLSRPVGNASF